MKTVIEMARAAGCHDNGKEFRFVELRYLERFAEIVRADEREKYKWDIHSCGPTCKRYACVAMREAVAAEREACAQVCDGWEFVPGSHEFTPQQLTKNLTDTIATQIRARGNT